MKVYKYLLKNGQGVTEIKARFREILGVRLDPSGNPCLYAIVDTESPDQDHSLIYVDSYFTGVPLNSHILYHTYLDTLIVDGLVYHYFWRERTISV